MTLDPRDRALAQLAAEVTRLAAGLNQTRRVTFWLTIGLAGCLGHVLARWAG